MTASVLAQAAERPVASCPAVLQPFVDAGVLTAADIHIARTICELLPCDDEQVLLGAAMAARAPRVGHTCLDVDVAAELVGMEVPGRDPDELEAALAMLSWPPPDAWLAAIAASPLAGATDEALPLVVEGRKVFLRRQYEQEVSLAADLRARVSAETPPVDSTRLEALLERLFPDSEPDDAQLLATRAATRGRLSVITGGPGTGKTWTVARVLAVLIDQARAEGRELSIALAAPTAKAAAQLSGGIAAALAEMDVPDDIGDAVTAVGRGQTIHSLLGRKTASRFWHDRSRPLRHDVVVIDETSMASLSLMARLLDAVRLDARVVLIGDPDQLASVEAGSVLADIVDGLGTDAVTRLTTPRRFGAQSGIAALAAAIRDGDADRAMQQLRTREDLSWLDVSEPTEADLRPIRELIVDRGRRMRQAAAASDVSTARECLAELVVLTPHRRGRWGVAGWNARIEAWYAADVPGWQPYEDWQPGRAVLATTNDRSLQVFNGDLGVVIAAKDGPRLAFHQEEERLIAPSRLRGYELVHAMTIHKSQGSQWAHVVVALPRRPSRAVTRHLLYTAATRAAEAVHLIGGATSLDRAASLQSRRASRLGPRLSGETERTMENT